MRRKKRKRQIHARQKRARERHAREGQSRRLVAETGSSPFHILPEEAYARLESRRIDIAAFALGLLITWYAGWRASDLVWVLWLSSLAVGFSLILWIGVLSGFWWINDEFRVSAHTHGRTRRRRRDLAVEGAGGLMFVIMVTLFFGTFHLFHSIALHDFFPLSPDMGEEISLEMYSEVVRLYWWFVPVMLLAERWAFPSAYKEWASPIVRRRIAANRHDPSPAVLVPYRNLLRMHVLIFFFGAAHALGIDHFAIFVIVYAVYFFPWDKKNKG